MTAASILLPTLVFIGRQEPRKGLDVLLRALVARRTGVRAARDLQRADAGDAAHLTARGHCRLGRHEAAVSDRYLT